MNQKIKDIYEQYRDEMADLLALEEQRPYLFVDTHFIRAFKKQVEKLDSLIALYGDLIAHYKYQ